jgi:ribosomal protein S18 acetylase RimI-like enzyme
MAVMAEGVAVRVATEADAAAIARLHLASYRAAYRDLLPARFLAGFDAAEREQRWRASLANPGRATYAATGGTGQILGFAEIGACRDDDIDATVTGELMALHVTQPRWRHGIGRLLHTHAVAALSARGFTSAKLWVLATNTRARAFYTATGWAIDGRARHRVIRGADIHEVRYTTRLSS